MPAVIRRRVAADPDSVWAAVTDFAAHGRFVPFTEILCEPAAPRSPHQGWRFIGRTRLGPLVVDDPMRLTRWKPPDEHGIGAFHAHKVGPVLTGWAAVEVRAVPGGATVTWSEHIRLRVALPRWLDLILGRVVDRASGWLFARVVDGLLAPGGS